MVEIEIGKKQYLPDGAVVSARAVNPVEDEIDPNPGSAPVAEARHFLLNPNNVRNVKIKSEGEGETEVYKFDPIQTAAHPDGNSHDRFISEIMDEDYDSNARVAGAILSGKQNEVVSLAGYIQRRKRITGLEGRSFLKRLEEDEEVELTVTDDKGKSEVLTEKRKRGEVVIFELPTGNDDGLEDGLEKAA